MLTAINKSGLRISGNAYTLTNVDIIDPAKEYTIISQLLASISWQPMSITMMYVLIISVITQRASYQNQQLLPTSGHIGTMPRRSWQPWNQTSSSRSWPIRVIREHSIPSMAQPRVSMVSPMLPKQITPSTLVFLVWRQQSLRKVFTFITERRWCWNK